MDKKMMSFFVNFAGFNEPLNFRDSLDWEILGSEVD